MSKPIDKSIRKYDYDGNLIEKYCKKCNQWYSVDEFHKHNNVIDNLSDRCKYCISDYHKEYRKKKKRINLITPIRKYDGKGELVEKFCKGCNQWFSIGSYYKHNNDVDGLSHRCKGCISIISKEYRKGK